ncbi:hypothetical protein PRIP_10759, partial [Listeria riparia FSL S10-1204]
PNHPPNPKVTLLEPAREAIIQTVQSKIREFGSAGKAIALT